MQVQGIYTGWKRVYVYSTSLEIPLEVAKRKLKDAYTQYKIVRKNTSKLRTGWKKKLAARQVEEEGGAK